MGCLRQGHRFSCVNTLEDAVIYAIVTFGILWLTFMFARAACKTQYVFQAGTTTLAYEIPCNTAQDDALVWAMGWALFVSGALWFGLFMVFFCFTPIDWVVFYEPPKHCDTCECSRHVEMPVRVRRRGERIPGGPE